LVVPLPRREISRYARNDKEGGIPLTRREGSPPRQGGRRRPEAQAQGGPLICSGIHAKCLFDRTSKLPLDFFKTYPIIIIQKNLKGGAI